MASGNIPLTAGTFQNMTSGYKFNHQGRVIINADVLLTGTMTLRGSAQHDHRQQGHR